MMNGPCPIHGDNCDDLDPADIVCLICDIEAPPVFVTHEGGFTRFACRDHHDDVVTVVAANAVLHAVDVVQVRMMHDPGDRTTPDMPMALREAIAEEFGIPLDAVELIVAAGFEQRVVNAREWLER